MSIRAIALLLLVASTPLAAQTAAPSHDVSRAGWLGGCWELRAGARVTQEQWMAPSGGVMLGMSRTTVRDTVREWEHLYLGPAGGRVAYVADPSGQAETAFSAVQISDSMLVFENPAHDFPQRIVYRRRGSDSLIARIEGPRGGQMRGIDFPYARGACSGGR